MSFVLRIMFRRFVWPAAVLSWTVTFLSAQPVPSNDTGSIAGIAQEPAGKPVAARVRAVRVRPTRWTSPSIRTSESGQFQITGLADGEYVVCASAIPASSLADPCFWLDPASTASVIRIIAGQAVAGQQVRLVEGRKLRVRVKDPQELLSEKQPPGTRGDVSLMLAGPPGAPLVPLPPTRTESDGYSFEVIVPANYTPKLEAIAERVRLSDAQQNPVSATWRQPVPLPAQETDVAEVVLVVSAR